MDGKENRKTYRPCKITLISLYSHGAIGMRYISSFLKSQGFDVDMVFFKEKDIALDVMALPTEKEYALLLELIGRLNPGIIGIGVRSSFLKIASLITERVRNELGTPVVWGGTHPTVAPEESIEIADMICIGEGEHPMSELAQRISRGQRVTDIQNLWVRKDGRIFRNPIRPLIQDLDSLPFPDYGGEGKYFIEDGEISHEDPALRAFNLDVLTSRGCPYHCSYCSNSIFKTIYKGKGKIVRRRSVSNVIEEIRSVSKHFPRLRRIDFIDEVFTWDKEWASEFKAQYRRYVGLPFHCMQHPNMADRDVLHILKEAGLERVEVGIQSGSEHVRKGIFERPVSDEALIKTGQMLNELDIVPFYDIIVDNPFETWEDRRKGLELLLKIPRPFHLHMFSLIYFPNTTLTRKALSAGLISEDQIEGRDEKTFRQFYVTLDYPRSNLDQFWNSLYSLTSKGFVPKSLIRWMSGIGFLQRHPRPLVLFANISNTIKLGIIALKWLSQRRPTVMLLKRGVKRKSSRVV